MVGMEMQGMIGACRCWERISEGQEKRPQVTFKMTAFPILKNQTIFWKEIHTQASDLCED